MTGNPSQTDLPNQTDVDRPETIEELLESREKSLDEALAKLAAMTAERDALLAVIVKACEDFSIIYWTSDDGTEMRKSTPQENDPSDGVVAIWNHLDAAMKGTK